VYVINDMCLFVAHYWGSTTLGGVWSASFGDTRGNCNYGVGFRAAAYHI